MKISLWDLYARFYDSTVLNFSAYHELLERIKSELVIQDKTSLLNIGCGTGNLEKQFIDSRANFEWLGIDQSASMLKIARKKIGGDTRFIINQFDMDDIECLEHTPLEYIFLINSLYASKDPVKILNWVYANLNEGGKVIIGNPKESSSIIEMLNYEREKRGVFRLFIILLKLFPSLIINVLIRMKAGRGNFHFFSKEDLEKILQKIGYKDITIEDSYAGQSVFLVAKK